MTKLEIFKKMMSKAKANGYKGDDYKYQKGFILDGTNINSLIFRKDFAKSIWTNEDSETYPTTELLTSSWKINISSLSVAEDKWKFIEENVKFND